MNKFLVSIFKKAKEILIKKSLHVATSIALPFMFVCGCGDDYTGPVYDDVDNIQVSQAGSGWGWTAKYPDWIFCKNAGGNIPDDSKVNSTGFNVFAYFKDPNGRYVSINDLPVKITNESGDDSVLGVWHRGEIGWNPDNCVNKESYMRTCILDNYNRSVALVTNGIRASWPIGGLYYTGTPAPGTQIGELGATFRVVDNTGKFIIYCPASSELVGAEATYNFRKYTNDYWFAFDWGQNCEQNFPQTAATSSVSMEMDNFKNINLDKTPNLASLESARAEKGIIVNPNYSNSHNSGLEKLVRSQQVMKKSEDKRIINPEDYEPITAFSFIKKAVMDNLSGSQSEEPLFTYHTRNTDEVWEAGAFYWTVSFYKPEGTKHINYLDEKFSKYGQTVFVKRVDKNLNLISLHKVKFFPIEEGVDDKGEWVGGWSNDIVPSWTEESGGIYLPQDPNTPLYYTRTVIPVKKGDSISNLMIDPNNAPFTIEDLRYISKDWLKDVNTCDYWDTHNDSDFNGKVDFKDYSKKARNYNPN